MKEKLSERVSEAQRLLLDAAIGPTKAALIIVPICENWHLYEEEAGYRLASKWVLSTFGDTLKYFKDRYRAVMTFGKEVALKVTHDAAVWLVNTFGQTPHIKLVKDAVLDCYHVPKNGLRPSQRVIRKEPLVRYFRRYEWALPYLKPVRLKLELCPTCKRRIESLAPLQAELVEAKKASKHHEQAAAKLQAEVVELYAIRDRLAGRVKTLEEQTLPRTSPGVVKAKKKSMAEAYFGAAFSESKKGGP